MMASFSTASGYGFHCIENTRPCCNYFRQTFFMKNLEGITESMVLLNGQQDCQERKNIHV